MEDRIKELEQELRNLRAKELERKRIEERNKEENFVKTTSIRSYSASDYCGLTAGDYDFYFGYEVTVCPTHGSDKCECDDKEWAFTVSKGRTEIARIAESKLQPNGSLLEKLLSGIGLFITRQLVERQGDISSSESKGGV